MGIVHMYVWTTGRLRTQILLQMSTLAWQLLQAGNVWLMVLVISLELRTRRFSRIRTFVQLSWKSGWVVATLKTQFSGKANVDSTCFFMEATSPQPITIIGEIQHKHRVPMRMPKM